MVYIGPGAGLRVSSCTGTSTGSACFSSPLGRCPLQVGMYNKHIDIDRYCGQIDRYIHT